MKKIISLIMLFATPIVLAQPCKTGRCPSNFSYPEPCYAGGCFEPEPLPSTGYDFTQQFNEKRYWVEANTRTGQPQICYQRLGLYPEFYKSAKISCSLAKEVAKPAEAPAGAQCWMANGVIVCQDPGGRVTVHHPKK